MNTRKYILFIIVVSNLWISAKGQQYTPPRLWKLTEYSGEAKIKATYRERENVTSIRDKDNMSELDGSLKLKTKSYFLSPRFLVVDANGSYNPGTRKENHLVFPDQGEERTFYDYIVGAHFFREQPVNFGASMNKNNGFSNRENIANMKFEGNGYGGFINYNNKWCPLRFTINKQDIKNKELATGREFSVDQFTYQVLGSANSKKFGNVNLRYNHNENQTNYFLSNHVYTIFDEFNANHILIFGNKKNKTISSDFQYHDQGGSIKYRRYNYLEKLSLPLPYKLFSNDFYQFIRVEQPGYWFNQNNVHGSLGHKWYLSITSQIYYDYNNIAHSQYNENIHKPGISFLYLKKLPYNCRSVITYSYYKQFQNNISEPDLISVLNEQVTLTDGQMALLLRPDITQSSILVMNSTGTLIYQQNIDYVIIPHGIYLELQRIPGGQISNNSTVLVSYNSTSNKSFNYNISNSAFSGSLFIYKDLIELFFNIINNDYSNVVNIDENKLNYFTKISYGFRLDYKFIKGGFEYTEYKSNMIPYFSSRYFLQFQKQFFQKLNVSLNGNYQLYHYIDNNEKQEFADVAGSIGYKFKPTTEITLESSYRKQTGRQMDLDLFIARLRFTTSRGKMYFSCGADVYRRLYVGQKLNFNSVFVQLSRKFGK